MPGQSLLGWARPDRKGLVYAGESRSKKESAQMTTLELFRSFISKRLRGYGRVCACFVCPVSKLRLIY